MKKSNFEEVPFFRYRYTYSKRGHSQITVTLTSYSSRTVLWHTEHKKQLLYFLESRDNATEQPWSESGGLSRVERIAHAFVTSVTSRHVWLKSGRSLTRRSLTGRSSSGVYVWGHAFNKKEDTLSIGCETVDKTVKW